MPERCNDPVLVVDVQKLCLQFSRRTNAATGRNTGMRVEYPSTLSDLCVFQVRTTPGAYRMPVIDYKFIYSDRNELDRPHEERSSRRDNKYSKNRRYTSVIDRI